MKIGSLFLCILTILTGILFSCRKPETSPAATITIYAPTAEQAFQAGDTIKISARIEGETNLHGYHLAITNPAGDSLFTAESHEHAAVFTVNEYWINTIDIPTELKISISSEINHNGLKANKTLSVQTQ